MPLKWGHFGVSVPTLGWWDWKLRQGASETHFAEVMLVEAQAAPAFGEQADFIVEMGDLRVRVPLAGC